MSNDEIASKINRTHKDDYYQILSVPRSANENEIKKAYKKLALKLHPDKNPSQIAKSAFLKVSKAFEVLSDPIKRRQFDQFGAEQVREPLNQPDPEEIFKHFFRMHAQNRRGMLLT